MPVPITGDQIAQLQGLVGKLIADKTTADVATSASNEAHAALTRAQADAASRDTAEAQADGQVNVDMNDLRAFVDSLAPVAPPPPTS